MWYATKYTCTPQPWWELSADSYAQEVYMDNKLGGNDSNCYFNKMTDWGNSTSAVTYLHTTVSGGWKKLSVFALQNY